MSDPEPAGLAEGGTAPPGEPLPVPDRGGESRNTVRVEGLINPWDVR